MKVSFLAENVQDYLSLLGKVIPTHSQIPVLSSILLEASTSEFTLSSTDLEFGVRVTIPAKIEESGGVLVPGKQFVEILSSLVREKALINQEKDHIVLTAGSSSFTFQVMSKDEFPRLFEEKGEKVGEFTTQGFFDIFSKLIFAVSQDESRPHLTGVYVVKKDAGIDYVATDGYRMSLKRTPFGKGVLDLNQGIIVSPRLIAEALSIKNAKTISLYTYTKGNQAIIEAGEALLVGRLIEGTYPDYERVLPRESKTSIVLDREELMKLLKTSSVFARENANVVNFNIALGKLHVEVPSSNLGESEAIMEGAQEGDDNHIAFNIKFVMDFLRSVEGENVTLKLNSPFEPALFTSDEDKEFLHVIMPVRIQE